MGNLRAIVVALVASAIAFQQVHASFQDSCEFYWGADRGQFTSPSTLELRLNEHGGTGIKSKDSYLYGSISTSIKMVPGNSAGTVTTFYLSSTGEKHDEIDFEFLGNVTGEPYTIHTNIFTQGFGQREMQFKLWFNPADDYHNYTIFWNPCKVVWLVDNIPIRVFRNFHDSEINFPDAQPMKAYSSLWDGDDWATQGGSVKTDWNLAPFVATLENYNADACVCYDTNNLAQCSDSSKWWTQSSYCQLTEAEYYKMKWIQNNYMIYNYCTDYERYNGQYPKECSLTQN